jgi:sodium-dependent phosphate cotransporter
MGRVLAAALSGGPEAAVGGFNLVGAATDPLGHGLRDLLGGLLPHTAAALLTITVGVGCIITAVLCLGGLLRAAMTGRAKGIIDTAIGRGPLTGIASGTLVTVLVQSSSTTTSLVVPLAGAGVLSTRQIYPFTLGANIGTCVTALLAATAITGPGQELALQIALVHLLYNVFGVLVFTLVPVIRELPLRSSVWLGRRVEDHRGWALGYIGGLFFVLPGVVFGAEYLFEHRQPNLPVDVCQREDIACLQDEVETVDFRVE